MKFSRVYILTNKNKTVLYTGVTSDIRKRIHQHKTKFYKGFTSKYNCDRLVYFEEFTNISEAIKYEKKIKAGSRAAKEKLILRQNPEWKDLSEEELFNF